MTNTRPAHALIVDNNQVLALSSFLSAKPRKHLSFFCASAAILIFFPNLGTSARNHSGTDDIGHVKTES